MPVWSLVPWFALAFAFPAEPPSLTILVDSPPGTPRRTLTVMREELEDLLGLQVGVEPWKRDNPRGLERAGGATIWVILSGQCQVCGNRCREDYGTLGQAPIVNGRVQPYVRIHCDRVRGVIRENTAGKAPCQAAMLFGRALGRILAHEIYHIYTGTEHRADETLLRPALTARQLTGDGVGFSAACRERLHSLLCN